ncbi:MAG: phosphate/phosphite/phosphonate ABC transporter substrate-binding protein [Planctomycetota bacterium]|nr:phosphate/phosphite/phosphonate ABC transporter substrate-binding protein [Planctomycetota bacterium]
MNRQFGWFQVMVWMLAIIALTGCDSRKVEEIDLSERIDDAELARMVSKRDGDVLCFGFDLRGSPDEDARQYLPFLKYMEEATGLRIELRFTPKDGGIVDYLGTGKVQFAAIGGGSYLAAHAKYGVIPLVRGLNAEGRAGYQSVIVVASDSPIRKIKELRGKRFAFGCFTSTQGHLIPRIILAEHGVLVDDLAGYKYTGSHQNCANAVAAGRFDAGGMQDLLGRRLAEEGFVRIIHTSEFYPSSGIAANRDLPPEVIKKVKQALLDFKPTGAHAEGLYHWDRTEMANGFCEAHDEDYAKLREWAIKFGLFDAPSREEAP